MRVCINGWRSVRSIFVDIGIWLVLLDVRMQSTELA